MRVVSSNKNVSGIAPFVTGPVLLETAATNGSGAYFSTPMLRGIDATPNAP